MSVTLERPVETGLLRFLALDLTRTCQAQCTHCYNQSSPSGTHGEMTREDWLSLLDQAAAAGVTQVQFIGGEPTLHPDIADLINKAVEHAMAVEVFSNLIHVRATLWPVLRQRGVTLATSYYSDQAAEHEAVTAHRGSYAKTKANITKALAYGIPLRAAIVDVREGQRIDQAITELREMGVQRIRTDRLRKIGRGDNTGQDTHEITELCGHCAKGRAAVLPDGSVAGCVMSGGMMTTGSVRTTPLAEIVTSPEWDALAASIPQPRGGTHGGCTPDEDSCQPSPGATELASTGHTTACGPDSCQPVDEVRCQPGWCPPFGDKCGPFGNEVTSGRELVGVPFTTACNPDKDGNDCAPAETEACGPSY
ncbi:MULTISPECIES: radical SAM/SPASM domain-containing protein [unclassified Streptomyces]|uniref:radical SAM/SPASM domain-containing protein n=1 Tax=unclassified Streptomyces TaxID=2593676 RepID=UPI002E2C2EB8|nr:radical SAM protein [Streptomyces sp. NBC_00223]